MMNVYENGSLSEKLASNPYPSPCLYMLTVFIVYIVFVQLSICV